MRTILFEGRTEKEIEIKWDQFVEKHPDGNIFQTPFYFNLFANNKRFKPIAILLVDKINDIKGVLVGNIQYFLSPLSRFFTSRCIVTGGPLTDINDDRAHHILLNELNKFVNQKVVYTQFRNVFDTTIFRSVFKENNYQYEDHLNIIVDLSLPGEILWKKIHRRRREQITKASKLGLTFKLIENQEDLNKSYSILNSLYKKIKLPLFPYQVFQNAFNNGFSYGYVRFFAAYSDDRMIGTMYTLCYKNRIYDFFAGSDGNYLHYFPNSFIPWKIFMWGKENGLNLFDWGGAGKPGIPYGVRDYKEKFGGEYVNYGRYINVHKSFIYQFHKTIFSFIKRLKF
jgi:serine/alanine adding enzyme